MPLNFPGFHLSSKREKYLESAIPRLDVAAALARVLRPGFFYIIQYGGYHEPHIKNHRNFSAFSSDHHLRNLVD